MSSRVIFKTKLSLPQYFTILAVLTALAIGVGCSGSPSSSLNPGGAGGGGGTGGTGGTGGSGGTTSSKVQVRVGDAPADRIVSFELTLGSPMSLTSNTGTKSAVTLAANRLEFSHLSGKFEPFVVMDFPQGSYSSADVTILNPQMTFVNANGTLTKLEGAPTQMVTVTFNPPLTIGNTASVLNVDLNVANSISSDSAGNITGFNFSGTSFTFTTKAVAAEDRQQDDDGELENVQGQVIAVSGTTMTVKIGQGDATVDFSTDSTTQFSEGLTNVGSTLNQIVRIEGITKSDGTLFAKEVEGLESSTGSEVEGLITRVVGSPAITLDIVAHDGLGNGMDDSKIGAAFQADVSEVQDSKYRIAQGKMDFTGLQVPGPDFPFDSSTVRAGQRVEVESVEALPPADGSIRVEKVTLQQQAINGTVSNFALGQNGGSTFDLNLAADGSSYLTVLSQQSVVHVLVQPGTDNRVGTIGNGAAVRVRGLLFWTGSTFNLIARRVTP
jgi:Domain of unknown function (DUF5666)